MVDPFAFTQFQLNEIWVRAEINVVPNQIEPTPEFDRLNLDESDEEFLPTCYFIIWGSAFTVSFEQHGSAESSWGGSD